MTEFEKIISKYTDAEQYYKTVGFYAVALRVWEMETRKVIGEIVDREGYGAGLQSDDDRITTNRKTYFTEDKNKVFYAFPRRYYSQNNGNLEVTKVEVIWLSYRYEDDERQYPTDENETVIPITVDDENRLMEITRRYENARKDYEAVNRTAVINLFNAGGIKTDEFKKKIKTLQDLANNLFEAVTMQDAENLQEIRYKQILALEGIHDDTRNELIREFCTKYYEADDEQKIPMLACLYANFANSMITEIPDSFIIDQYSIYKGKQDRNADEEELYLLLKEVKDSITDKAFSLGDKWFSEIGGDYVRDKEKPTAEDDAEKLQRLVDGEAVIQDYKSPKRQMYPLTKAQRVVFDDQGLADEITMLENGQLSFKFAVSRKESKTQKSVILEIDDKIKGLTKFDAGVFNAVCSIIEAGNDSFTSKQVAIQNTQNSKPSKNMVGAHTKSIDKMRVILHKLDATEHFEQNRFDLAGNTVVVDDYLLPAMGIEITMNNGEKVKGYKMIKKPPLLNYAKLTKQLHTVDNEVLNVPVRLDEKTLAMRDYLIRQIGIIYNSHSKVNNNILINTVLSYAGIDLVRLTRVQRQRHVDKIKLMLEYWDGKQIAGERSITNKCIEYGYKLNYNGKTLESITINPRPKKKDK